MLWIFRLGTVSFGMILRTVRQDAARFALHREDWITKSAGLAYIAAMPVSKQRIADKGYDSAALRECLVERRTEPVIPRRKNHNIQYEYDKILYKQRNVICWLS
jgi:hypothetical protein